MDSSVNRSLENILLHCLKRRVSHCFSNLIDGELKKTSQVRGTQPDALVETVVKKIFTQKQFSDLEEEFSRDFYRILEESDGDLSVLFEKPVFENQSTDSLSGSLSSLNSSSIDFLSSDQLSDIVHALASSSMLRKIETLGTLNRLSTLEHITKQTLWTDVEAQLHRLIVSSITVLQDATLTVFIKMLSSSEPQVVCQGFISLTKVAPDVLPINFNSHTSQFKFAMRLLKAINRFQLHIPSLWLRYPHKVIDSIISSSVALWNTKSKFMWNVIPTYDLSGKWVKNFLYDSIARSFFFNTLQERGDMLHLFYKKFQLEATKFHEVKCCVNLYLQQQVYAVCCMSYFLRYKDGRNLLDDVAITDNGWKSVLNQLLDVVWHLCTVVCIQCFMSLYEAVPYMYGGCWSLEDIELLFDFTTSHPVFSEQITVVHPFSSFLLFKCLFDLLTSTVGAKITASQNAMKPNTLTLILRHFLKVVCTSNILTANHLNLFKPVFCSIKVIVSLPLCATNSSSIRNCLLLDYLNVVAKVKSTIQAKFKNEPSIAEQYQELVDELSLEFLRSPIGISVCHKAHNFDSLLLSLLDKISKGYEYHKCLCVCDTSLLISALSYELDSNYTLKLDHLKKIEAIIASIHLNEDELGDSEGNALFLNLFLSSVLGRTSWPTIIDSSFDSMCKLISHLMFLSHVPPKEIYKSEDNVVQALSTLTILIYDFRIICIIHKFCIQELLIGMLSDFVCDDGNVLICPVTVLLNFIIVKLYSISGPEETVLPLKDVAEVGDIYSHPYVFTYPPHLVYRGSVCSRNNELITFDFANLEDVQEVVANQFKDRDHLSSFSVSKILVKSMDFMVCCELISNLPQDKHDIYFELNDEVMNGISVTAKYSTYIAQTSENVEDDVEQLLQQCLSNCLTDCSETFDVFVSCIYLMMQCDQNAAWSYLKKYANCKSCIFAWKHRSLKLSKWNSHTLFSWAIVLECCDYIVMESIPTVFSAFKACGVLPSLLFDHWISQCFWNYLDWIEICNFIVLISIFGGEYALFYFVAVLKHLRGTILQCSYSRNLVTHMKRNPIVGYKLSHHMSFIMDLAKKYNSNLNKVLEHIF